MLLKMRGCLRGVGESSRLLYTLAAGEQPAVVVGVHHGEADNTFTLTPAGSCSFFIIKQNSEQVHIYYLSLSRIQSRLMFILYHQVEFRAGSYLLFIIKYNSEQVHVHSLSSSRIQSRFIFIIYH